jgi:hypothetical protein
MNLFMQEDIVIALLTKKELARLRDSVTPSRILQDAYYTTLKYKGEEH